MSDEIARYVSRKINWLRDDEHRSRGVLAEMRRGVGFAPGDKPELWALLFEGMPESMMGSNGRVSRDEWAIYAALTLFAIHQQGHDINNEPMHREKVSLGRALNIMCGGDDEKQKRIKRRFDAMATAASMEETVHYLRGLVQLLKAEGIALDYAMLARDLYWLQVPEYAPSVRLTWGQDFYRMNKKNEGGNKDE